MVGRTSAGELGRKVNTRSISIKCKGYRRGGRKSWGDSSRVAEMEKRANGKQFLLKFSLRQERRLHGQKKLFWGGKNNEDLSLSESEERRRKINLFTSGLLMERGKRL